MGKATVTQNLGEGRYKIQIDKDMSGIDDRIEKMQKAIDTLTVTDIPAAQEVYDTAVSDQASQKAVFDTLVSELRALMSAGDTAGVESKRKEVQAQTAVLIRADSTIRIAAEKLSMLNLQKLAGQKEIDRWTGIKTSAEADIRDAWAVDYTTDIKVGAEVGIVEINGETMTNALGRQYIKIAPLGKETPGNIKHGSALTAEEFYIAKAFKPGWQRWRPTYRIGTITEIDHEKDKCTIFLGQEKSEIIKTPEKTDPLTKEVTPAVKFEINPETTEQKPETVLKNVPIEYMECNSDVFAENDRVVIKFTDQDWEKPVVIGFEYEPIGCGATIQIRLSTAVADPDFIALMDERIADCDRYIAHLDYLKDTFLPAYYTHMREMTAAVKTYFLGTPVPWTMEEIEQQFITPWEDWVTDYYPQFRAQVNATKTRYNNVKTIANFLTDNLYGTISGTADPADEMSGPVDEFVITIGLCNTTEQKPDVLNTDGLTQYLIDREKDRFGNTLLDNMPISCSPETEVDVYAAVGDTIFYRLSATLQGAYDAAAGLAHIVATDLDGQVYGVGGGWIDGMKWIFDLNAGGDNQETILSYPNRNANAVATIEMPAPGGELTKTLGFSMQGTAFQTPENFGAEVGTWEYWAGTGVIDGGESIVIDEGMSFFQIIANFDEGLFNNSLVFFRQGAAVNGIQEQ